MITTENCKISPTTRISQIPVVKLMYKGVEVAISVISFTE